MFFALVKSLLSLLTGVPELVAPSRKIAYAIPNGHIHAPRDGFVVLRMSGTTKPRLATNVH